MRTEWNGFTGGEWEREVNVRDFIQKNYHPYDGDESFLAPPTQDTLDLWDQVMERSSNEFVFWIRGGSRIVTKNFFNEFMLYAKRKDIAAIDSKILSEDMTVFSGGLTISENKIRLRCQGAADNYAGYENGMLHNRNVYAGSGLGTMVFKSIWEKQKGFRFETPIPILSYTCFCTESGYCNLWTPFVKIQGDFMILQEIYQSERVKKKSDPYLHEAVYRLHLE